jgi:predicted DCC family thiol-disulfide oxidoreductase YuxK
MSGATDNPRISTMLTGGQYSVLRGLLGVWLLLRSLTGIGDSLAISALSAAGAVAAALLMVGLRDRWAGLSMGAINLILAGLAGFGGQTTLAALTSVMEPAIAVMLPVAHALTPRGPFGAMEAIHRTDPAGGWGLPAWWRPTLTGLLCLAYLAGGVYLLTDPAWRTGIGLWSDAAGTNPGPFGRAMTWAVLAGWLAFAGVAIVSHLRAWVWLVVLMINSLALTWAGYLDLAAALGIWHLMVFDPAWAGAVTPRTSERLFYDGHCGLCHRWVRLVLAEDQSATFRLSPLQSQAFERAVPAGQRQQLPDSIVIQQADGTLLVRSRAVRHILYRLGGLWRVISALMGLVPAALADVGYRVVARLRNRFFAKPTQVCPLAPPALQQRFEL